MVKAGAVMLETKGNGRRAPCGTVLPEASDRGQFMVLLVNAAMTDLSL